MDPNDLNDQNTEIENDEVQDDLEFTDDELGNTFEQPRNSDGTFASNTPDEGADDAEGDGEDPDADDEDVGDGEDPDADDEDEGEDRDAADQQNFPIRVNRAKRQRDEAREELARTQGELEALRRQLAEKDASKKEPEADPEEAISAELDTLYDEIEAARYDGDKKLAAQLQRQIDSKNRDLLEISLTSKTTKEITKAKEMSRLETMFDVAEAAIPEMRQGSDEFSTDLLQVLDETAAGYERLGIAPTEAFRRAVILVYRMDPFRATTEAKPDASPKSGAPRARKTNVAAALDRDRRTPPDSSGRSRARPDERKRSALDYTDEEFDALPQSKQDELLGNTL